MKTLLALCAGALFGVASAKDYTGHTIQRCSTEAEDMQDLIRGITNAFSVDVLAERGDSVDVLVEPKLHDVFQGLHCQVVVPDVQRAIEDERAQLERSRALLASPSALALNDTDPYHKTYHRYGEIVAKVNEVASKYPTLAKVSSYGSSLEGRDLVVVRITGNKGGAKKTVYINGGIHAREWISSATVVYIIQTLAERYGSDAEVTKVLDAVEFHIAPSSNPDGYEYTWTNDRMWRKNRNSNGGASCMGVDLNRNFDVYWGTGSSSNKCAQDYHGARAASEPEVSAIQKYVAALPNLIGAIDIHAYGQYIMRPYGWTYDLHPQEKIVKELGDGIVERIRSINNVRYSSIRSAELYPVSGASDDWFTVKLGLWGFCFELRDQGRYGFRLPEDQILPTGQEIFGAILHYATFVLERF